MPSASPVSSPHVSDDSCGAALHTSSSSASNGPRRKLSRSSSRRFALHPVHIPIPPSLVGSPYLESPDSIFRHHIASPQPPRPADEEWLQDTVPLDSPGRHRQNINTSPSSYYPAHADGSPGDAPRRASFSSMHPPNPYPMLPPAQSHASRPPYPYSMSAPMVFPHQQEPAASHLRRAANTAPGSSTSTKP
ncbi:hypothetical protein FISHEDRAFT_71389 [Fistulina hepatica ATCC 64428]|nr:hypothetical protein FISHEDRAFT_71389 [Fistulina hepatica ATCC 64428]